MNWFKNPVCDVHIVKVQSPIGLPHWGLVSRPMHVCMIFFVSLSFIHFLSNLLFICIKQNKRKKERKKVALY